MEPTIDIGLKRCGQRDGEQCPCVASYRYTWPGREESFICSEHVGKLRAVARAMGLPLQIVELELQTAADVGAEKCRRCGSVVTIGTGELVLLVELCGRCLG